MKGQFGQRLFRRVFVLLAALVLLYLISHRAMTAVGGFLVHTEQPVRSDVVVVLSTGVEYYPRLMEAAALFREGFAMRVAINGNRKTEAQRELERTGFKPCCRWYEETVRVLEHLGVPRERVIPISAEDAYDTVSEAKVVGKALVDAGVASIILTTSKYHTRRARYVWKVLFPGQFTIRTVAARYDPFARAAWWKDGRQIRWVLTEYGGWIYDLWKTGWRGGR